MSTSIFGLDAIGVTYLFGQHAGILLYMYKAQITYDSNRTAQQYTMLSGHYNLLLSVVILITISEALSTIL